MNHECVILLVELQEPVKQHLLVEIVCWKQEKGVMMEIQLQEMDVMIIVW